MANYYSDVEMEDVGCPSCGAPPGQPCARQPSREATQRHRFKRLRARNQHRDAYGAYIVFREGLLDEVQEVARRLDVTAPDFIETAIEARLASVRAGVRSRRLRDVSET